MKDNRKRLSKKDSLKTFKRLIKTISKTHKLEFFIVLLTILLSSIGPLATSLSLKFILDDYILPLTKVKNPNFSNFYTALTILGILFLISVIACFISNRLIVVVGQKILKDIRNNMFSHMETLPIKFFDEKQYGDIMSLYTNDTDTLRQMIDQSLPNMINALFSATITFITMFYLSPILTIFAVIMLFIVSFTMKTMTGISGKFFMMQQKNIAKITGFCEETIKGQKVVKIFNHEEKSKKEFDKLNEELFKSSKGANIYVNNIGPVMGNLGNVLFVIIAIVGGTLSIKGIGNITVGTLAAYLQLTRGFTQPFMQISQNLNSIVMALAGAKRIFDVMDEEKEDNSGHIKLVNVKKDSNGNLIPVKNKTNMWAWEFYNSDGNILYKELKGDIKINNMDFGYTKEKQILHNISLYAKPGQKIAFVGATGAGKTTITNLINRFYKIDKGTIQYDDIDIYKINKTSLRHSLGIVLQETHLFTDTIMENIRFGRLDASDEEVIEAAKLAHADEFINMLPQGYNTVLTSAGNELSQGQKQLISIARAAVSNPPVLILDEATSSIDTRTEQIVQKGMDNLMKNRTVFVIAHRLSTIKNADAIMVLDHGKIIEKGNHESLIKKKGIYYQLYTGKEELQ